MKINEVVFKKGCVKIRRMFGRLDRTWRIGGRTKNGFTILSIRSVPLAEYVLTDWKYIQI